MKTAESIKKNINKLKKDIDNLKKEINSLEDSKRSTSLGISFCIISLILIIVSCLLALISLGFLTGVAFGLILLVVSFISASKANNWNTEITLHIDQINRKINSKERYIRKLKLELRSIANKSEASTNKKKENDKVASKKEKVEEPIILNNIVIKGVDYYLEDEEMFVKSGEQASDIVVIEDVVELNKKSYPIKSIGFGAFTQNGAISEVIIGKNISNIEQEAFSGCVSLRKLYIPDNVTHIEDEAFAACLNLEEISISSNTSYVGANILKMCPKCVITIRGGKENPSWDKNWNSDQLKILNQ